MSNKNFYQQVIALIKEIPEGKVTTYGTIATLAGSPRAARIVGGILHAATKKEDLPWQRVINRDGYISIRSGLIDSKRLQKQLLEQEGVEVSADFLVDLEKYGWQKSGKSKVKSMRSMTLRDKKLKIR